MSYQTCIKDREAEIEKLRNQVQISKAIVYIWYTTICISLDFDIIMLWEWKILNAFVFCDQIMTKSMSSSTEGELEARVKTLTESLIQKQTTLETLSTQKNSLALQLERLEVRDLTVNWNWLSLHVQIYVLHVDVQYMYSMYTSIRTKCM